MEKNFEIELTLEKKNRKYFAATKKNGCAVKILIDKLSENLSLGKQTLRVVDISVRSRYGFEEIYRIESAEEKKSWENPVTLKAKYNENLVRQCRELAGKWDAEEKVWVFSKMVEDKVDALDYYFGSKLIPIEITAKVEIKQRDWVTFLGYRICGSEVKQAPRLADGVAFISGAYCATGSWKNWFNIVDAGSVYRLEISSNVLELFDDEKSKWKYRLI
jgi:hypothetical protein